METKNCQNCKTDFTIESEDFKFYEKMDVPAPTFCPECRMLRRYNFRNESMLFRRIDAHDGKEIFSGFSPDAPVVTYENSYWYSTDWDSLATGMDYNFTQSFFEQFKVLLSRAPILSRSVYNMINSDYCQEASECKNCYLCFNADYLENCAYLRMSHHDKEALDCYELTESELCYENVLVHRGYKTFFSLDCENSVDVYFSKGLHGCTNCFGCVNLINKSNYFFNEPLSLEEYKEKVKSFNFGSHYAVQEMLKKAQAFWLKFPNKFFHGVRIINSTGELLYGTRNVKDSYFIKSAENLRYCQNLWTKTSNCYDYSVWGDGAENIYECMTCGMGAYNLKFCFNCWGEASDLEYCVYCLGSKNCFGCVGLYKKEYCIFNKQYTKETYFAFVEKIKKQMNEIPYFDKNGRVYAYGEFFPYDISPTAYNESSSQEFAPLTEKGAKEKGYQWREIKIKEYQTTIDAKNLPDDIADIDDRILNEVIKCNGCAKAYRITALEFNFYKRFNLPLPRFCHNCRFTARFNLVNLPLFWHRKCMNAGCQNEFKTSYDPAKPDIVYCEKCYQAEVY